MATKKKNNGQDESKKTPKARPRSVTSVQTTSYQASDIPEVAEYEALNQMYEQFKAQHAQVLTPLAELASRRNAALVLAEKAVRMAEAECGSFVFARVPAVSVKAEKLVDELGLEQFTQLGGQVETVQKFKMDPICLDRAIAENRISPDDAEQYVQVTYYYKGHKPVNI